MDPVEAALEAVASRRPAVIDLGLPRIERALARLGDPHRRLPPVFHIAGTNGKGSTVAYLRSIFERSGARIHVFTSPHLVRYAERITLAGEEITDTAFVEAIARVDRAAGDDDLTLFELITCAAFLAFSETPADYVVLETGLGGRLDATNVIAAPAASVITPIALDHQNFLGDTLGEIAREKAGVFKPGAPAVVCPQTAQAMAVFEAESARSNSPFAAFGVHWTAWEENGRLIYQDEEGLSDLSPPRLFGRHQIDNAGLAVAAIRAAAIAIDDETISKGLASAIWPARLQRLKAGPLVDILDRDGGAELWLDGGHNPHAARAIASAMAEMEEKAPKPLMLITGMQENKDATGFYAAFAGLAAMAFAVQVDHSGSRSAQNIAESVDAAGIRAEACGSLEEAALKCRASQSGPLRVLVCGSLYLAGEVLRKNA